MTPEELKEADRQERKESMTPFELTNMENTFGLPVDQHVDTPIIGSMSNYSSVQMNIAPSGQMSLFGNPTEQASVNYGDTMPGNNAAANKEIIQGSDIVVHSTESSGSV